MSKSREVAIGARLAAALAIRRTSWYRVGVPRPTGPGLHDPYWYEAVVGLRYVVDLLDDASGVRSVTFQAPGIEGVDDVVVEYAGARRLGIQVKHTRTATRLQFSDVVGGGEGAASLLRRLSRGWRTLMADGFEASTELFTNRQITAPDSTGSGGVNLGVFWSAVGAAVQGAQSIQDVAPPPEYATAWTQWLQELDELTLEEQLAFLRGLRIDAGALDFDGQERAVLDRLTVIFGDIRAQTAEQIFDRLVRQLTVWTTSRRGDRVSVTREQVLAAIGLPREETVGEHDFAPPAPFFRDREAFAEHLGQALLAEASSPIVFLTGPAGCGKTSIVSALANRLNPIVDLRFHAFRPISPETATLAPDYSRTATAVALWGDLLIQLRMRYFAERLADFRVPARNDLLNDEPARLRSHVLRLAALLAEQRGRPTVIAIDGLDHAARGRTLAPEQLGHQSLLDWLVPPSDVPAGVRFLIAGQPYADAYPSWLREGRAVHVEEVPLIATADVELLLRSDPGAFPSDQIPRAAAIISELSRGNTLAAVYAAVEARSATDAADLRARLERRQLQDGLEEYYNRIWEAAVRPLRSASAAVDVRLATALAISSARLTGGLLQGFFPDATFDELDWQRALQALAPIVEERGGTFAVRHNDVRIFLTRLLQRDADAHVAAASSIADYYRNAPATPAKHVDLVRALMFANRHAELPAVFTPNFVVDGWVVERSVAELTDQAHRAMSAVTRETGWETLHTFALGLRTLQQLQGALQWLDEEGPPAPLSMCLPSEASACCGRHHCPIVPPRGGRRPMCERPDAARRRHDRSRLRRVTPGTRIDAFAVSRWQSVGCVRTGQLLLSRRCGAYGISMPFVGAGLLPVDMIYSHRRPPRRNSA